METTYSIVYLVITFAVVVCFALLAYKVRNSVADTESKLTGIWVNEAQSIRIVIHHIDSVFQGEVVWVNNKLSDQQIHGFKIIRELALVKSIHGSTGIYADPINGIELPFKMWMKGRGKLKFDLISKINGKDKVIREEFWFKV